MKEAKFLINVQTGRRIEITDQMKKSDIEMRLKSDRGNGKEWYLNTDDIPINTPVAQSYIEERFKELEEREKELSKREAKLKTKKDDK